MSKNSLNQNTFTLRSAFWAVSLLAVAFALSGFLIRYNAAELAESDNRNSAHQKHASTMAEQIATTARVLESERRRIERMFTKNQLNSCSGPSEGTRGWEYELRMGSPSEVVVDVVATADIVNGELKPITITTKGGVEDQQVAGLLTQAYAEAGWKCSVLDGVEPGSFSPHAGPE